MSDTYELYQEGRARLKQGLAAQATVPLEKAKRREPDKASIREALGLAYCRLKRWEDAETEFRALLEHLTGRRLRPLRPRPHTRAARPQAGGESPLQAGELAQARQQALLVSHPRPRPRARGRSRLRAVVQRVAEARVVVDGDVVGEIGPGLCVLLGVARDDDAGDGGAARGQGRPPAHLRERRGQVRPLAARHVRRRARRQPVHAHRRYREGQPSELRRCRRARGGGGAVRALLRDARGLGVPVATGRFGARMRLGLVNDGPVTIVLDM